MKKLFSILLTVAMMATMALPTFAVTTTGDPKEIDVKAEYKNDSTTPEEISAVISWDAMEFTYTVSGENKWNATDHNYTDNTTANWSASGNTITVVNHSNVNVTVTFTFEPEDGFGGDDGVKGSFTNSTLSLKSAANVGTDAESLKSLTGTTDLTLTGKLKSGTVQGTKVGTVTVSIKKNA